MIKIRSNSKRKLKGYFNSNNLRKNLLCKRILILSLLFSFFLSSAIIDSTKIINKQTEEKLTLIDEHLKLSNQEDDIFKLIYGTWRGPSALDPQDCWDSGSAAVIDQVCEGLFGHNLSDPDFAIIPKLASDNGTWVGNNYTVPLRHDVFFHDGTKFNATAVNFTFSRLAYFMENGLAMAAELYEYYDLDTSSFLPIINHTEIEDEYTIKFVLNKPYGPFEALLCFPGSYILSPTSTNATGVIDTITGDLVGTGPFVYDHYIPDDEVKFHAFDDYWAGNTNISVLEFSIFEDIQSVNDALLSGEVDIITDPMRSMYPTFDTDPDITLYNAGIGLTTNYLGMNNHWINVSFRKAISYAINYSYIIEELLGGGAVRLKSPIPEGIKYANWSFNVATYNVSHARIIMQSMGFGVGWNTTYPGTNEPQWQGATFETFNYTYNIGNTFRENISLLLQNNLDLIGIDVTDAGMNWTEYIYRLYEVGWRHRNMVQLYWLGWIPDYNDPSNLINPLFTNRTIAANGVKYNGGYGPDGPFQPYGPLIYDQNEDVQLLMEQALFENDPAVRESLYDKIQQLIVERDMPWAFGYVGINYDAYQNHILGFQSNAMEQLDFHKVYQNSSIAPHNIYIEGNQEWIYLKNSSRCTGNGTYSDPYVLKDLVIDGRNKSVSCIRIEDSDVFFRIENCTVFNSTQGGIEFRNVNNSLIINNNCINNNYGIYINNNTNVNITANFIQNNNIYGITLNNTNNDLIFNNTFTNNYINAQDNGTDNNWDNGVIGNYWDDYPGYDDNFDGIGDTPYSIPGSAGSQDIFPIWTFQSTIHIDDSPASPIDWAWAEIQPWCSGFGTFSDPYIIDGLNITARGVGSSILIGNSSKYFIVRNCKLIESGSGTYDAGIRLDRAGNGTLINNTFQLNSNAAIYSEFSSNNTIYDNFINTSMYGIYLWSSNINLLSTNTIQNCSYYGIFMLNCTKNTVTENYLYRNIHGIVDSYGFDNSLLENTVIENYIGIGIGNSVNITISMNDVIGNTWGILIQNLNHSFIINNNISQNGDFGIYLSGYSSESINNTISQNTIMNTNETGLGLNNFTKDNLIFNNEFINNYLNAQDNGTFNLWDNGSIGNYWSDYGGVDANDDGIGDTPYLIPGLAGSQDNFPIWVDGDNLIPVIIIHSPVQNEQYKNIPPNFHISIDEINLNSTWYYLSNATHQSNNYYFSGLTGQINQFAWDAFVSGLVDITFSANDMAGNIGFQKVSVQKSIGYWLLNPFIIDDTGLGDYTWAQAITQGWCGGTGTWNNPYIIEYVIINGQNSGSCIEIRNSNVPFIIRNSIMSISGSGDFDAGIKLNHVNNSLLYNITGSNNNNFGIILIDCLNNTITESTINDNSVGGILLYYSDYNSIINNTHTIHNNGKYGILLNSSNYNIISGNYISNCQYGIYFYDSSENQIIYNIFYGNDVPYDETAGSENNDIDETNEILSGESPFPIDLLIIISIIAIAAITSITIVVVVKKKLSQRTGTKLGRKMDKKQATIRNKLQKKMSFVDYLIKENKIDIALKNLEKVRKEADASDFNDIFNRANERITYCNKLQREPSYKVEPESVVTPVVTPIVTTAVAPVLKIKEERKINVFLSYSTLDSPYFQIPKIVKALKNYPDIEKVLFWEKDSGQNIVEFMEATLAKSDVFVLFCSENSMKSLAVKDEWQSAFQMRKKALLKIIPVYDKEDHIPYLLWQLLNVQYTGDDFQGFIEKLHDEILR